MAIQSPSQIQPYSWEEVYKAAVFEPDNALSRQRIKLAQEALATRWLELTKRNDHGFETQAIVDAIRAVQNLKREQFGI